MAVPNLEHRGKILGMVYCAVVNGVLKVIENPDHHVYSIEASSIYSNHWGIGHGQEQLLSYDSADELASRLIGIPRVESEVSDIDGYLALCGQKVIIGNWSISAGTMEINIESTIASILTSIGENIVSPETYNADAPLCFAKVPSRGMYFIIACVKKNGVLYYMSIPGDVNNGYYGCVYEGNGDTSQGINTRPAKIDDNGVIYLNNGSRSPITDMTPIPYIAWADSEDNVFINGQKFLWPDVYAKLDQARQITSIELGDALDQYYFVPE